MADPRLLDRAFELLMRSLVQSGRALHYAELARAMACLSRREDSSCSR
jgi:hypothetical protein